MTVKLPIEIKLHDLIELTWLDSFHNRLAHWEDPDEYADDTEDIVTVGYFLRKTSRFLIVAQSVHEDSYGSVFRIPVGCITKVVKIR